jgi:sterol desaturase/sphingolipid hydroxylase (fatty acid hydroxylase superfamily)
MFHGLLAFYLHFFSYWFMVWKYDEKYNIEAVRNSLKNQAVLTLPLSLMFFNQYPIEYNNILISAVCIPLIIVMSDIYFYCAHRPFHSQLLWKYHRNHHHGTVQVSKSLDADTLEHAVANLGSFIVGFLILWNIGIIFNIYLFHIWVVVSTVSTCISHADKRILGDVGAHEIHHKRLKYNYGTGFYIMDRIMGTYRK